ncbi:MAG: CDP-alcohol phosphatidyltransferase family protein [Kofleriaceae bacterium]|jgi:phosphatidylglycerophosphate synthase|nr:CDP-alcohol phosphatidyltransferase family protein [Kofleriaceae bacterium]MBP6838169.1 CDP-alcohol phosphatidyltransferase family protein [Kofleriaceae bacterium]MBP9206344.1 CDP-alcohol phosphatidyltransferase family protein [Kofleriaceae bacterium]
MNLFALRGHVDKVLHPIVAATARLPIHANTWTVIGAGLGLLGGAVLYYGWLWAGFALLLVRGVVDHIDGYKARNFGQRSTFGAIIDDTCDRWVLGIMFTGGCLYAAHDYPHVLIVLGAGITGALTNVIIKLSIYAEAQHDISRATGKLGHPVDVVGLFGSAEFIIYFGAGIFGSAVTGDPRPLLVGCWLVAIMSHVSLLQRVVFARTRYRHDDPAKRAAGQGDRDGEGDLVAVGVEAGQAAGQPG